MADKGRYWELEGENATAQAVDNVLSDLTDILTEGPPPEKPENVAVIWVEGDSQGDTPKERRDHFELGEAGGGLETKPTYYTRKEQFNSRVQNVPDGTGRYIEVETEPNPTKGTWTNPRYPDLKMNDPIYIGTKIKKKTITVEGEQVEVDVPGQNYLMISDEAKAELRDGSEVKIAGKAKLIIGDTDPERINSVTSWNPTQPGCSWSDTIYGPTLRFHGTSCMDIDDGYLRKTPTLNIHGAALIDFSDGSQSNGTYYTTVSRHRLSGTPSMPWGDTSPGPWLHMHNNATLIMEGGSIIKTGATGALQVLGNCYVQFDGNTNLVFGGGEFKSSGSPVFDLQGVAEFRVMNSGKFICESSGNIHYGGSGNHDFINNGNIHITNDISTVDSDCPYYKPNKHSSLMQIDIHSAPSIQIDGFTQIQMHGYALHRLLGASMFQMYEETDSAYSPRIDCTSNQLEFFTKGARAVDGGNGRSKCEGIYPSGIDAYYVKTRQPQASGIFQGNSHINYGGYGSIYTQFTNNGGEHIEYYVMGNTFAQYSGNGHTERHDGSIFIMRGLAPTSTGDPPRPLPSWYDGHVPQASLYKAHLGKTWGRGEIHSGNGPDVEFFDRSRLHMHGYWIDGTVKNGSVEFETEDTISSITDVKNCQDYIDKLVELNMDIVDDTDATYSQQAGTNKYVVTGLEYKLINWSEHPEKNASNPLVEIIEDAEVRCMGDTKFILTDSQRTIDGVTYNEGLTIAVGNDSVNFSIADLVALKNMIPTTV